MTKRINTNNPKVYHYYLSLSLSLSLPLSELRGLVVSDTIIVIALCFIDGYQPLENEKYLLIIQLKTIMNLMF